MAPSYQKPCEKIQRFEKENGDIQSWCHPSLAESEPLGRETARASLKLAKEGMSGGRVAALASLALSAAALSACLASVPLLGARIDGTLEGLRADMAVTNPPSFPSHR